MRKFIVDIDGTDFVVEAESVELAFANTFRAYLERIDISSSREYAAWAALEGSGGRALSFAISKYPNAKNGVVCINDLYNNDLGMFSGYINETKFLATAKIIVKNMKITPRFGGVVDA